MSLNKRLVSTGIATTPTNAFAIVLYSGNGSTQSITGVGFKPDMVWIKPRNQVENHTLHDSSRGSTNQLAPNSTATAREQGSTITSFDSDGFTTGSDNNTNKSGINYVAWCWRANEGTTSSNSDGGITSTVQANDDTGFSIVTYAGNNASNATIGHGLSAAPKMVWVKALNHNAGWPTMMTDGTNDFFGFRLNQTSTDAGNGGVFFNYTRPTSTVVNLGGADEVNDSYNYIAYCFADVDGMQKIGSYVGNGSANRVITTGFQPDFVFIKSSVGTDHWYIYDTARGFNNGYIVPNATNAENTANQPGISVQSTSWTILSGGVSIGNNVNNNRYYYLAIKKSN